MSIHKRMVWTEQAVDCYNIGCWCSKCLLNETMNNKDHKCSMKATVLELVRRYGRPQLNPLEEKKAKLDIEEIKAYLQEGMDLKGIASKYGVSVVTLRKFTHANGLRGIKLFEYKKKKGKWD